ncbi:hypothetical protein KCV01_g5314, partial [Aureobasidium melanogenum]
NRADLVGGVSLDDKDDTLAAVLLDLQQGYAMQASESIAGNVLKALGRLGPTHRGYVERANFVVLRSPDVPSILVETAFITNPAEERRLRDDGHRRELASAVLGGVRNYFESMPPPGTWFAAQAARRNGTSLASTAASAPAAPAVASDANAVASDAVKSASRAVAPEPKAAKKEIVAKADTPKSKGRADDNVRDVHRVTRGETLTGIAQQYGVSVGALKLANKMTDNNVRIAGIPAARGFPILSSPAPRKARSANGNEVLRQRVVAALEDLKAKDVREIDVRGKTSIADILFIASGTSARHVKSIADEVVKFAKEAGVMPLGVEGQAEAEWVLVDLGDIIVHVMLPRIREFYGLERLWTVGDDGAEAAND